MRFLVFHKSNEQNEEHKSHAKELIEEMGKLMESDQARRAAGRRGRPPQARRARASAMLAGIHRDRRVTFSPRQEGLIAGFSIIQVDSKEGRDRVGQALRAKVIGDVEIEIRQVVELSDFA